MNGLDLALVTLGGSALIFPRAAYRLFVIGCVLATALLVCCEVIFDRTVNFVRRRRSSGQVMRRRLSR